MNNLTQTICCLLMALGQQLYAQVFTNYTTTDGLINNNVICVDIDTANRVWFGTQAGISMFDGSTWTSYDKTSHPTLVSNTINTIMVASDNKLWVGTDFGISVFDGTSFTTYTTANGLGNNRINDISEDNNGVIWVGEFSGLSKFNGTSFTAYGTSVGLPFGGINHVEVDANNELWLGSGLGGVVKYNGTSFIIINTSNGLLHNVVRSITIDDNNNKWVGTAGGVSVINAAGQVTSHHTRMLILPAPDTLNPVEDIDVDGQGRIWVGVYVDYLVTEGGVAMYNGTQWTDYDVSDGLIGPVVRQIDIDANDNVWVATSTGISKISMVPNAIHQLENQTIDFQLFPNPANDYLTIKLDNPNMNNYQVTIYSAAMQELATYSIHGEYATIPLDALNQGLYFARVDNQLLKFMVNR